MPLDNKYLKIRFKYAGDTEEFFLCNTCIDKISHKQMKYLKVAWYYWLSSVSYIYSISLMVLFCFQAFYINDSIYIENILENLCALTFYLFIGIFSIFVNGALWYRVFSRYTWIYSSKCRYYIGTSAHLLAVILHTCTVFLFIFAFFYTEAIYRYIQSVKTLKNFFFHRQKDVSILTYFSLVIFCVLVSVSNSFWIADVEYIVRTFLDIICVSAFILSVIFFNETYKNGIMLISYLLPFLFIIPFRVLRYIEGRNNLEIINRRSVLNYKKWKKMHNMHLVIGIAVSFVFFAIIAIDDFFFYKYIISLPAKKLNSTGIN